MIFRKLLLSVVVVLATAVGACSSNQVGEGEVTSAVEADRDAGLQSTEAPATQPPGRDSHTANSDNDATAASPHTPDESPLERYLLHSSDLSSEYRSADFGGLFDVDGSCGHKSRGVSPPSQMIAARFESQDSSRPTIDQVVERHSDGMSAYDALIEALVDECSSVEGQDFTIVQGPAYLDESTWIQYEFGEDPATQITGYSLIALDEDVLVLLFVSWLGQQSDHFAATRVAEALASRLSE